jgi:hypothetical protein
MNVSCNSCGSADDVMCEECAKADQNTECDTCDESTDGSLSASCEGQCADQFIAERDSVVEDMLRRWMRCGEERNEARAEVARLNDVIRASNAELTRLNIELVKAKTVPMTMLNDVYNALFYNWQMIRPLKNSVILKEIAARYGYTVDEILSRSYTHSQLQSTTRPME